MTAPSRTYIPGTDVIDITAPDGVEQLLAYHRATFGAAVMRANLGDPADDPDDDGDPVDDPDDGVDPDEGDDDGDPDDDEGREQLGDKGQKALDRMKAKRKADRARIRELEQQLAAKDSGDAGGDRGNGRTPQSTTADKKADRRIVRSEVKAAAKGVLADPKDALTFLDLDQFEVDENGDVDEDEIADAIAELVEKKPYLAAQGGRRFQGTAGGGSGNRSRPKQLTKADIDRLTPEQIIEARRKGQLDGLLKGTR